MTSDDLAAQMIKSKRSQHLSAAAFQVFLYLKNSVAFFPQRNQSSSLLLFSSFFFLQIILIFFRKTAALFNVTRAPLCCCAVRIQTYAHAFVCCTRAHTNTRTHTYTLWTQNTAQTRKNECFGLFWGFTEHILGLCSVSTSAGFHVFDN
jgi:hypothetical protein